MNEFEDDDDVDLNAPLDIRFVVLGLLLLISGLIIIAFVENVWIKYVGFTFFLASFLVMIKKDKRNTQDN